ncbi:MAG: alpha-L-fucosidase [Firmicutes bacterium]|nr:alpha-L-fucosidase [Bacillota bacterium]
MPSEWYEKSFRRSLADMHIEAWDASFLSRFDPRAYADCLKKARIQSPMIYANSHVGYCNWPTKTGEMHPGFGGEDKIKTLIGLCHGAGMDVIAYYSLIFNNWAYARYPEWRMRDLDGFGSRDEKDGSAGARMFGGGRYGLVCPNNPEYRRFLRAQFAELCENYTFEGIFLDMTFWPIICYCGSCAARYREEYGEELPRTVDWNDACWRNFQAARERWMSEFAEFCTAELKNIRPGLSIEHQFSTVAHPWTFGVRRGVSDASDYSGGDLYGGLEQQSFICKLYYSLTRNQPFEYMTSRCDPGIHDHTTTKPPRLLKRHAYLTYAHHGAFLAIDAIDPRGTLNARFYDTLGEVFGETKEYEPFFRGRLFADAAVYFSMASKMDVRMSEPRRAVHVWEEHYSHLEGALGAGGALRRSHIPYAVVAEGCGLDYPLLILSDVAVMSDEEEAAIALYVENGGLLYMSGLTSPNLARKLLGLTTRGLTAERVTYIRPSAGGLPLFENMYDADYPMTVFGAQTLASPEGDAEILAYLTLPYTDPRDTRKFASIHSNPPGVDTQNPSIVRGNFGKGSVIWSAAPFEASAQPVHRKVFINLLNLLTGGRRTIETDAPEHVECTVFKDGEKTLLHFVNLGDADAVPFDVTVRTGRGAGSVKRLPGGESVAFAPVPGGGADFTVSGLDIFAMYEIG